MLSCDPIESVECPKNASCITPLAEARLELDLVKRAIFSMAQNENCNQNTECFYAGLGSKPCGGPWEYFIYSSEIDTAKLHSLIKEYNDKEYELNRKYNLLSDCSLPSPPDSIKCENGCVAYYQGVATENYSCCD